VSQCQRVLDVLKDGRWHTITEIHERAGMMRLNSRVAELRSRGHNIVHSFERTHFDEKRRPQHAHMYRLVEPLESQEEPCEASPGDPSPPRPVDTAPSLSGNVASSSCDSSGSARLTANPAHGEAEPLQLSLLPPVRSRERWAA
jgi:hypothetical protein